MSTGDENQEKDEMVFKQFYSNFLKTWNYSLNVRQNPLGTVVLTV